MKQKIRRLLDLLRQPTTIAGLSALGVLVGLPPGTLDLAGSAIVALAGIAGVCLDERKAAP